MAKHGGNIGIKTNTRYRQQREKEESLSASTWKLKLHGFIWNGSWNKDGPSPRLKCLSTQSPVSDIVWGGLGDVVL